MLKDLTCPLAVRSESLQKKRRGDSLLCTHIVSKGVYMWESAFKRLQVGYSAVNSGPLDGGKKGKMGKKWGGREALGRYLFMERSLYGWRCPETSGCAIFTEDAPGLIDLGHSPDWWSSSGTQCWTRQNHYHRLAQATSPDSRIFRRSSTAQNMGVAASLG